MPTNINFIDKGFDRMQETELLTNTPVLVLHISKDNNFYFVASPFYVGWVNKKDIVLVNNEDFNYYINNPNFIVITEPSLNIDNYTLDMSVKLPVKKILKDAFLVSVATKENDTLVKKEIIIPSKYAHLGYLNYSKENLFVQAILYLDTPYSWGGYEKNVDCSSFVGNVFRTFNLRFPRNTGMQSKSVGNIKDVSNFSNKEKLNLLKNEQGVLLYKDGHVMLYLGYFQNKHYIIHASGDALKVKLEVVDENTKLIKEVNKIISVDKNFY